MPKRTVEEIKRRLRFLFEHEFEVTEQKGCYEFTLTGYIPPNMGQLLDNFGEFLKKAHYMGKLDFGNRKLITFSILKKDIQEVPNA